MLWADNIYQQLAAERLFMGDHEKRDPATTMLPDPPVPDPPRTFSHADGSTYSRIPAAEFESGDEIDSTTVVDDGAPE